jgi:hypothetical protein
MWTGLILLRKSKYGGRINTAMKNVYDYVHQLMHLFISLRKH